MIRLPSPPASCIVSTPKPVADALVRALGDGPTKQWLDPCIGQGSLVTAMASAGVEARRIRALDLDSTPGIADGLAQTTRAVDFVAWAGVTSERFDRIIANPPYVPVHLLPTALAEQCRALLSMCPNKHRRANYWAVFVHAAMHLIAEGGSLGLILPAAWTYADYGACLRESLPSHFQTVDVHRCAGGLFGDVREGSIILVGRGYATNRETGTMRLHRHKTFVGLERALRQAHPTPIRRDARSTPEHRWTRLGDILHVGIGAVTGAVTYFLISEPRRQELGLPLEAVHPVLSRASHLTSAVVNSQSWQKLLDQGERVWLFSPSDEILTDPAVSRYLAEAGDADSAIRSASHVRRRQRWFRPVLPAQAEAFLSGMTRFGPWLALNSIPRLSATNTLYIASFRDSTDEDERAAWAETLLHPEVRAQVKRSVRIYTDGLSKLEPADIEDLVVPRPWRKRSAARRYEQRIARLLAA